MWEMVGLESEESVVVVEASRRACDEFTGVSVAESEQTVEIVVSEKGPDVCPDVGVTETFRVRLENPLADRQLVGCERGADDDCRR